MQLFSSFASEPHLLKLGLDASTENLTGSDLAGLIIHTDLGLVLKQSISCSNMKRERANGWNGIHRPKEFKRPVVLFYFPHLINSQDTSPHYVFGPRVKITTEYPVLVILVRYGFVQEDPGKNGFWFEKSEVLFHMILCIAINL